MFEDIITLCLGHGLIHGDIKQPTKLNEVALHIENSSEIDFAKLGFFDSATPNYANYYPDAKPEDFEPKDSEFIYPVVRALSEVTVHRQYMATSFSRAGVLRESMDKLYGQTIYIDHETAIGNAIGSISEVSWQGSYKAKTGETIPGGINVKLKIDAKANPRLARLMVMDPPAIHSFSVTVRFAWEKSHPEMPDDEFYKSLGTYDAKGVLIQRMVTKVLEFREISLVSHGADPYAKIIKDGEIVLPGFADRVYRNSMGKLALKYDFYDNKEDILKNSAKPPTIPNQPINNNTNNMKELLLFLAAQFQVQTTDNQDEAELANTLLPLVTEHHSQNLSEKVVDLEGKLEASTQQVTSLTESVQTLTQAKADLEVKLQNLPVLESAGKTYIEKLKEEAIKNYSLVMGDNASRETIELIKNGELPMVTALHATYTKLADQQVPLHCAKCNSLELTRGTAKPNPSNPGSKSESSLEEKKAVERRQKATSTMHQ